MPGQIRALTLALALLVAPAAALADQKDPALDGLFRQLKAVTSPAEADRIESEIWSLWRHRGDQAVDDAMRLGIIAMHTRQLHDALSMFDRVVRAAPDFAEGWNKRATVYYLLQDFDASVADIRRTLALEPRHFGALSGLGLIYDALEKPEAAINVWEKALEIHPHMEGIRKRIKELRADAKGKKI